jgi:5-oxopent-3-ene-1,2,5-tricarboxylate decarboxylase/2-hydroxyhepta-2,4-diene-1,7-dioate isomerase
LPINGTVYGVAWYAGNAPAVDSEPPNKAPNHTVPNSPVLFIKPHNTFLPHGGTVQLPPTLPEVEASAALALVFARDTRAITAAQAMDAIAGYTLVIDLSEPGAGSLRPPIREKCRDGFLPVGPLIVAKESIVNLGDIVVRLEIDGKEVASFCVRQEIQQIAKLIEDVSAFMTFRAGDVLLAAHTPWGPRARVGSSITATAEGLGRLDTVLDWEKEVVL